MWKALFITLGLCYGALATENEVCRLRALFACPSHRLFPKEIPENLKDLRNACLNVPRVKQCIADYLRNCNPERSALYGNLRDLQRQMMKFQEQLIDVVTEVCDENSELHQIYVRYMPCLKSAFETEIRTQACSNYTENAMEFLRKRIQRKERRASENKYGICKVRNCMTILLELNCGIIKATSACDSGVKQPILEIIEKLGSVEDRCPTSSRGDVIKWLKAVKRMSRQEMHAEELISLF